MGHTYEMAKGSEKTIFINSAAVPTLPEAREMASMGIIPKGAYGNRKWLSCSVDVAEHVPLDLADILFDPQTSGGLLIAVSEKDSEKCLHALSDSIPCAEIIGYVEDYQDKYVVAK